MKWDNPYWEYHLPINPPINPGTDIDVNGEIYMYDMGFGMNGIEITNHDEDGYRPRLRTSVPEDWRQFRAYSFEEDFEPAAEYDCE